LFVVGNTCFAFSDTCFAFSDTCFAFSDTCFVVSDTCFVVGTEISTIIDSSATKNYPCATGSIIVGILVTLAL
jgi:hypothetical protein